VRAPAAWTGNRDWTPDEIPDLTGKRALVTGVTSGIGEQTVIELARKGAEVVLAARNESKLAETVERVRRAAPTAEPRPLLLDLADLGSVRRAAEEASTASTCSSAPTTSVTSRSPGCCCRSSPRPTEPGS
jgi:NAD(P)-dependent dehydrogenase (short-subunit alcohol dehydrogenase family)